MVGSGNECETHFLNVDLDLSAEQGLGSLIDFLRLHTSVLHDSPQQACFETLKSFDNIDDNVNEFIRILSLMDGRQRLDWQGCQHRTLNIGIKASTASHQAVFTLSKVTLSGVLDVGCDLAFTVYTTQADDNHFS
jgi:hypothetical protein